MDLFVLADSNEQEFEFLNIVDLATRFNICYQVPSKRLDDVLSVLEMVWINWAGPMSHLISDMGGEFEGELGEFMEAHGIRQYFTASDAPWQNGLVEGNGGIWKAAASKTIKDVGNAKTRLHGELCKKNRPHQLVWMFANPMGHRSRIQIAVVTSG